MKLPLDVVMESYLSNPKLQFYITTNHSGVFYNGLAGEVPQSLDAELSQALKELVLSGRAVRVLSPTIDVGYLPMDSCIAVVAKHRAPDPHLLYSEKLAKEGFTLYEQLVIQRHIHVPAWNYGPLGIDRMDNTGPYEFTKYTWMTNSGSGHIDWVDMTEEELIGMERLVEKKIFIPMDKADGIYGMMITKMIAKTNKLPEYVTLPE